MSIANQLIRKDGTALADESLFKPQAAKKRDAQADAVIDYAKQVKDWPTLTAAVETKMDDQREFVGWWDEKVRGPGKSNSRRTGEIGCEQAETQTGISNQQVSKWRRRLKEPEKYREMLYGSAYYKAMAETNNTTATKWTGNPESYTPEKYVEAARATMGGIDLDPASNDIAQKIVKAEEWYDGSEDGLLQNWIGRVFLNPPYNYPLVAQFIDKLCQEFTAGNVIAAILLTNNNTDTKWWHSAASHAAAVCFTAGRINFYKADGSVTQPTNGQTFFYFGSDVDAFCASFAEHGLILFHRDG